MSILREAWEAPLPTRGNFVRGHTEAVNALGCMGLLTVLSPEGTITREWRLTEAGLRALMQYTCNPTTGDNQ